MRKKPQTKHKKNNSVKKHLNKYAYIYQVSLLLIIVSLLFIKFEAWNYNSHFDLTRAIVDEQRLTIDTYAKNTGDRAYIDGHYYSEKSPGISFLLIPVYATYKLFNGQLPPSDESSCAQEQFCYENYPEYENFAIIARIFISMLPIIGIFLLVYTMIRKRTKKKLLIYTIPILIIFATQLLGMLTQASFNLWGACLSLLIYYLIYEKETKPWIIGIVAGIALIMDILTIIPILIFFAAYTFKNKKSSKVYIIWIPFALALLILIGYNYAVSDEISLTLYGHVDQKVFGKIREIRERDESLHSMSTPFLEIYDMALMRNDISLVPWYIKPLYLTSLKRYMPTFIQNKYILKDDMIIKVYGQGEYLIYTPKFKKIFALSQTIRFLTPKGMWINKTYADVKSTQNTTSIGKNYEYMKITELGGDMNEYLLTQKNRTIHSDCPMISIVHYEKFILPSRGKCTISSNEDNFVGKIYFRYKIVRKGNVINIYTTRNNLHEQLKVISSHMVQILFYKYNGLFIFNIILIPAFLYLIYNILNKRKYQLIALSSVAICLAVSTNNFWWGGTTFGPRLLSIVLILLIIPFMDLITSKKTQFVKYLLVGCIIVSCIINFFGLFYITPELDQMPSYELSIQGHVYLWMAGESITIDSIGYFFKKIESRESYLGRYINRYDDAILYALIIYIAIGLIMIANIRKDSK